eukprot:7042050-Pyramimonas_sp.AAC.1
MDILRSPRLSILHSSALSAQRAGGKGACEIWAISCLHRRWRSILSRAVWNVLASSRMLNLGRTHGTATCQTATARDAAGAERAST